MPESSPDRLGSQQILAALRALERGDFSVRLPRDLAGADGEVSEAFNAVASTADDLVSSMLEMRQAVGRDGRLGRRIPTSLGRGAWARCIGAVNDTLDDVTRHAAEVARVVGAVGRGDLSHSVDVSIEEGPLRGEFLRHAREVNSTVRRLAEFVSEVTRVAQEVGVEGKLGAQARVDGISGEWKQLTDAVNLMASHLTAQVREIARITTAVAQGDLTKTVDIEARGEILALKETINTMVDQLNSFASEVTRVAREVGTEGRLGGQAHVRGVSGIWLDLTENVNSMAHNLTSQVRNVALVITALNDGDLSHKITVDAQGEMLALKDTINGTVNKIQRFTQEVTRVARLVGTEGTLGVQADIGDVSGVWRELTDTVNQMGRNLTDQVRDIADVTTAVANGDLSRKITVEVKGEILALKNTINAMVDSLSSFASEVTRVAREVGTEGVLGGQAEVHGVSGIWAELTENVNSMATRLTDQVRNISQVATAIANGDLKSKIVVDAKGEILELKETINTMVDQLGAFAEQVTRVAREVGTEGKLGGQASVEGVSGIWRELTDNVNLMASNLTNQVRDIARVTTAVANGDLSRKITVEVRGEILELKDTINTMVDQLSSFADEVTRVAGEVGTSGILGGQAQVRGVSGIWRELTDNVNLMARNLTEQVRGIARVVTAAANGDLKQELTLDAQGEIATLVETINNMLVTLSTFADQVTSVARDVGVEGKLGGQADVPGAAGIWADLTKNVNELAGNLTRQVRAIADVATAVTKGDLTQSITVEARGEVALLKDNLNQMILTLAETTRLNEEQDWLKTNLTRFTRMLQGQRELLAVARQVLSELATVVDAQYGSFYMADRSAGEVELKLFATYAMLREDCAARGVYAIGEGFVGQAASDRRRILVSDIGNQYPATGFWPGMPPPYQVVVVPIVFEGEVKGVIELASVRSFTTIQLDFLEQLIDSLGIVVATIEANMRTDQLLSQSQGLARELQKQQEELRKTNEELEEKARQLIDQKGELERKSQEVGSAKREIEEKAHQLALTSRYKSQFLANMSHELRTPLNGLLILSKQLAANQSGALSEREVEFARTIYQSGADLLSLINEILDLAKIESGTMTTEISDVVFDDLVEYVERSFRPLAEEKELAFVVELADDLPRSIETDDGRLRQVLRNLLSNAFKFTERGEVRLRVWPTVRANGSPHTEPCIGFTVSDTGIGIPEDKQIVIFEAFQQADGSANRKYGGTGLGLAISREISGLLEGELAVESAEGKGSAFTLYVPLRQARSEPEAAARRPQAFAAFGPTARDLSIGHAFAASEGAPETLTVDPSLEGARVLVVDDDVRNIFALTAALERYGADVLHAENGHDALTILSETDVDAVLMDIMMPELDGYEATRRLRQVDRFRDLPIIALTAQAMKGDREKCLAAGASDYVSKPVDPDHLAVLLRRWIGPLDSTS